MYFSFIYLIFLLNETHFITTLTSTGALLVNLCLFNFFFFFFPFTWSKYCCSTEQKRGRKKDAVNRENAEKINK